MFVCTAGVISKYPAGNWEHWKNLSRPSSHGPHSLLILGQSQSDKEELPALPRIILLPRLSPPLEALFCPFISHGSPAQRSNQKGFPPRSNPIIASHRIASASQPQPQPHRAAQKIAVAATTINGIAAARRRRLAFEQRTNEKNRNRNRTRANCWFVRPGIWNWNWHWHPLRQQSSSITV